MGAEEFFNAIRERCSSDEEYAAELLKARGFLLEDHDLALSDNSHRRDEELLREILKEENIGDIKDGKIIIFPNKNLENLFSMKYVGGSEAFCDRAGWPRFVHDICSPKIPISLLEPFVARYIKAISACGARTCGSCDGNHPTRKHPAIIVETCDQPNMIWHSIICKRCLLTRFNLNWVVKNRTYNTISISEKNKWRIYVELNRAAEFLYNNRIMLRQIKREALNTISSNMAKHLPEEELAKIFSDRAKQLLDNYECKARIEPD